MKPSPLLLIPVRNLLPEGLLVRLELSPGDLEIDEEERISWPTPLSTAVRVMPVSGALTADGTVATEVRCRCDRCLAYYTLALPHIVVSHQYLDFKEDLLDLTEDIRDDILLALPQRNLCQMDCRGLCPDCGQNLNARDCGCRKDAENASVWGALSGLDLPAHDGSGPSQDGPEA